MKIFLHYLKDRWKIAGLLLFLSGLIVTVYNLYNMETEGVFYGFVLFFVFLMLFGVIDFYYYNKKHRVLTEWKHNIHIAADGLPKAEGLLETDYQEIILQLFEYKQKMETQGSTANNDMLDYYTMWAHQIKTPIAAMRLLLQSGEQAEAGDLQNQLFKIEQYVEMVLQYLRSDSISSDLVIREYSLDDTIRQAVKKYSSIFIKKKISLHYEETGIEVLTDQKWLVFVIEQVLSNALKYTREGSISIYLSDRERKILVIEDTGTGIEKQDLPRVFEKGYTGYNGRDDKRASGIGLYLCKKTIDKLGHKIWIESEKRKGTKVFLDLAPYEIVRLGKRM